VKFLSTGGEPDYINAKVASMELMEAEAAYEILVVSDSDVRVTPDYLRAVALPFADEKVGAMCCPYRGVAAEGGLWARLEAVGMSVEMTAGVLVARMMEGMQFVLGPTMAFRRDAIRRMGGFKVTADYCADDFVLGNETFKLGQTVVLSHARDRSHGDQFELLVVDEAPGAVDEVDALFAAQGALWDGADFQSAVWVLGWWPVRCWGMFGGEWRCWCGAWRRGWRWRLPWVAWWCEDRSWFGLLVLYPVRDLMGFGFGRPVILGAEDSLAGAGV
jgi:ceramide glucosyltransferase